MALGVRMTARVWWGGRRKEGVRCQVVRGVCVHTYYVQQQVRQGCVTGPRTCSATGDAGPGVNGRKTMRVNENRTGIGAWAVGGTVQKGDTHKDTTRGRYGGCGLRTPQRWHERRRFCTCFSEDWSAVPEALPRRSVGGDQPFLLPLPLSALAPLLVVFALSMDKVASWAVRVGKGGGEGGGGGSRARRGGAHGGG
jgi:hypothetical protein